MTIGRIVLLVKAYDEAITFYTDVRGWKFSSMSRCDTRALFTCGFHLNPT
jgi:predicted enzyme related to lactoylglutathione lyase